MTTADIRQSVKDTINGKVMAGPVDDPFEQPMTFNEAVQVAKGVREELGLAGRLFVSVDYYSDATGYETLEWKAFYTDDVHKKNIKCLTPEAMVTELRAALGHIASCKAGSCSLRQVGSPSLASKGN